MKKLTSEERFKRAEDALKEAKRLASQVTENTDGRKRAALITKTRTQYNKAHSVLGAILRIRNGNPVEKQKAETLLDKIAEQIAHARRFSK